MERRQRVTGVIDAGEGGMAVKDGACGFAEIGRAALVAITMRSKSSAANTPGRGSYSLAGLERMKAGIPSSIGREASRIMETQFGATGLP